MDLADEGITPDFKGTPLPVCSFGWRRGSLSPIRTFYACKCVQGPPIQAQSSPCLFAAQQIGKMRLRRGGSDVALIGYGNPVNDCLAAAELLEMVRSGAVSECHTDLHAHQQALHQHVCIQRPCHRATLARAQRSISASKMYERYTRCTRCTWYIRCRLVFFIMRSRGCLQPWWMLASASHWTQTCCASWPRSTR